ncbi:MAG: histidine phosphatase family protein [Thaumarchaeota archaeon]|nr:histidine phosphatase family protein [Nitrososphaerota archaeon]
MAVENIFIVRHGETVANEEELDAGPIDYPLDKKGLKDVSFIAEELSGCKIDAIYCSPVLRAVETAKIIAHPHKLKPKALEELTEARLKPEFIGKAGRHHLLTTPYAFEETYNQVQKRMLKAVSNIKKEGDGNAVVVSHGDPIVSLLNHIIAKKISRMRSYYSVHPDPASLSIVNLRGRPTLVLFNYHRKLLREYRSTPA